MKKIPKNLWKLLLIVYVVFLFSSSAITARATEPVKYIPLEPSFLGLPSGSTSGITFGEYITRFFSTVIGLAIILAVLMIVWGGFQYLSTDAITDKDEGRDKWTQAIYGLVLVLSSYLLLQTINKQIVTAPNTLSNLEELTLHRVEPIGSDLAMDEANRQANIQANQQIRSLNQQADQIEALGGTQQAESLRQQADQIWTDRLTQIYEQQGPTSGSALNTLVREEARQLEAAGNFADAAGLRSVGTVMNNLQAKTKSIQESVSSNSPTQTQIDQAYAAKQSLVQDITASKATIDRLYGANSLEATRFNDNAALNLQAAQRAIDAATAKKAVADAEAAESRARAASSGY